MSEKKIKVKTHPPATQVKVKKKQPNEKVKIETVTVKEVTAEIYDGGEF